MEWGVFIVIGVSAAWFVAALVRRRLAIRSVAIVAFGAAALEAARRKQERVTIEHVALVLSFDPTVEARLEADGIDVIALREGLDRELGPAEVPIEEAKATGVRPDGRLKAIMRFGIPLEATALALFDAIVDGPDSRARTLLADLRGTSSAPAPTPSGHAVADSPYRSATEGVLLRFHNDKKTSAVFVWRALVDTCGLEPARASYLTTRTHLLGAADAGRWPRAEASSLAERIQLDARAAGYPLRVELVS